MVTITTINSSLSKAWDVTKVIYTIFYGTQIYGSYGVMNLPPINDIPDGVYIYDSEGVYTNKYNKLCHWSDKWLDPLLEEDVPKELRALALILNL